MTTPRIAFESVGSGPAVILLHGTSANHAVWAPIAAALAPRAQVVSLDQRGHGRSDKPETGYEAEDFAGDVFGVMDELGIDRAIIAGHSLGGRNAWCAGALQPDRVVGVLSVDYVPFVEPTVVDALETRVLAGDQCFEDVEAIEAYLRGRYPLLPADAIARRAAFGYDQAQDGSWSPLAPPYALQQVISGLRTPHLDEFESVRMPLALMRGETSTIVSPAAWELALAARPSAASRVIAGADHYIPEELPDAVVEQLNALLASTTDS